MWFSEKVCLISLSPRLTRGEWRMEQETQGPGQRSPHRVQGQHILLSISRVHLYSSRGTPFSQGHQEKGMQTVIRQVVTPGPQWSTFGSLLD